MEHQYPDLVLKTILKMPVPASVQVAYEEACSKFGTDKVMLTNEYEMNQKNFVMTLGNFLVSSSSYIPSPNFRTALSARSKYWLVITNYIFPNLCASIPYWKIIIHFPTATVTNENNEHIDIYDLFVSVNFTMSGRLREVLYCRTTYTKAQINAGYCHSHTPRIYDFSSVSSFNHVCLGSGPIGHTIYSLINYADRVQYKMFFIQLDTIVHSESLAGGPYIKLSSVGTRWVKPRIAPEKIFLPETKYKLALMDCVKSYLNSGRLSLGFRNGQFCLACTFDEWLIEFSDYVHKWLNTIPEKTYSFPYGRLFTEYNVSNNEVVMKNGSLGSRNFDSYQGKHILTFNGVPYYFKIIKDASTVQVQSMKLMRLQYGLYIIQYILKTINYYYGQQHKGQYATQPEMVDAFNRGNYNPGTGVSEDAFIV